MEEFYSIKYDNKFDSKFFEFPLCHASDKYGYLKAKIELHYTLLKHGLDSGDLVKMNDEQNKTFSEIADFLESKGL